MKQQLQPFCFHREDQHRFQREEPVQHPCEQFTVGKRVWADFERKNQPAAPLRQQGSRPTVLTHHCDFRDMQDLFV